MAIQIRIDIVLQPEPQILAAPGTSASKQNWVFSQMHSQMDKCVHQKTTGMAVPAAEQRE
jgi:hypothetical protein